MGLKRRQFTQEFKVQVVREIEAGKSLAQVAREHQVHSTCLQDWRKKYSQYGEKAFAGNDQAYTHEAKSAELERIIGQQAVEIAFLKRVLVQLEASRSEAKNGGSR